MENGGGAEAVVACAFSRSAASSTPSTHDVVA
jgi:hypothetical protein